MKHVSEETPAKKILTEAIRNGDTDSVAKLADLMKEHDRGFVESRIKDAIEKYKKEPEYLRSFVLKYIFNVCVKCGSQNTSVKNFDQRWRDGDITCDDCGEFIRYYDAS